MLRSLPARLKRPLIPLAILVAFPAGSPAAQSPPVCPPEAQAPRPEEIAEGMRNARDRGFLWRMTKGDRTSYLYGTVHVGRREWVFPGPEVFSALKASEVVALELDVLDPGIMRKLQEGMARKPSDSLPDDLTARLRAQLKEACLPEQILASTSPEMVATTLTMMSARHTGLDPSYAVDAIYAGMAHRMRKPVSSLETPELQLKLLLGSTPEETRAAVESALEELENGQASPMVTHMAEIWAGGRLGELENFEAWCQCLDTERDRTMMKRLLDERNPGLAARIDEIHASGKPVFAAVGSLHMVGKLGLPSLLAERGYRIERVDFKP